MHDTNFVLKEQVYNKWMFNFETKLKYKFKVKFISSIFFLNNHIQQGKTQCHNYECLLNDLKLQYNYLFEGTIVV